MVIELTSFDLNLPVLIFADAIESIEQKQLNTKITTKSGKEYLVVESAAEIISDLASISDYNTDPNDLH